MQYGRVFSFAALSHECVVLDQLAPGVRDKYPSSIMALLARHHLETWLTGTYLFMGGDAALAAFQGSSRRPHEALRVEIEKLRQAGVALDVGLSPLEDFEWGPARWKYERAAQELDRRGSESGLLHNALATCQLVCRTLSGTHGAHPTRWLLDSYIETGRMLARVLPQSRATPLRRALLQMSLVLRLPDGAFGSTQQSAAQQEERT